MVGAVFSFPSAERAAIASYAAGAVGLVALHERLRLAFERGVALTATLIVFTGTSLFWSMTRDESVVEAGGFALVAVVLLMSEWHRPPRIPPIAAWSTAAAAPIALRLLVVQASPAGAMSNTSTSWSAALFSSSHGLLSLTPVAYLALLGMLGYLGRNRASAASAMAVLILWILALTVVPPLNSADGPFDHGLTAALAVLSPGLAFAIDRARARPWLAVAPLVLAAVAWNYWLMVQYTVGMLPKDAPTDFGSMVRQQADAYTRPPYHYPFAFPANVLFAWREGMPVDRYELVADLPRLPALDLTMDRRALPFLLEGWEAPGPNGAAGHQWIREHRATLAVPLEVPTGHDVDVFVTGRARLEEPAVNALLGLEINGREIGRFVVPAASPVEVSIKVPAAVGRVWRAGYNRVTFVSHGVERVDPSDQRPPGPLGSRSGDRAWPVAIYRIRIQPS